MLAACEVSVEVADAVLATLEASTDVADPVLMMLPRRERPLTRAERPLEMVERAAAWKKETIHKMRC